ncbi:CRISPR-associated helicase Cas3' [Kitasatospora kifunensis]|uniref:CRISPR-associated helicase Cas3/CRISPR-associated endonuclease Cas3-HD n=1 Tax=Kitasatospora kifunensis TaxID=58351 RepID=A0A7W7QYC6_KITKI|nr:CRISPR-associated helicase Cas3' [Kitasatospora kifunensis]MBB4921905.1 CRISPR-associated helicase Cas3/CRISPR-associated endonuclease Cas3-HD [Kitasatospora kifunensis]
MEPAQVMSEAARTVWAKHDKDDDGWLPLWQHMADSGAVAGLLWDNWLPAQVRRLVADVMPQGESDARRLAVWLARVHDIGKATPAFAYQVEALAERMRTAGLAMPPAHVLQADRKLAPHGLAGQLLLQQWLEQRHSWRRPAGAQFAVVVGGHHGVPPEDPQITALRRRPELLHGSGPAEALWQSVQAELLELCAQQAGVVERLADWRQVQLPQAVQVLLSALVIVADWIASNRTLFPYVSAAGETGEAERAQAAWDQLDLPGPWQPAAPPSDTTELFAARFDLPEGAKPRPVQEAAARIARTMAAPGLLIVEAPMGEGKTEAALAATEVLAARSGAGGVFFALPTMATSNAMFPRLLDWLDRVPAPAGQQLSVLLAHSKAALNRDFNQLRTARGRSRLVSVEMDGAEELPRPGGELRSAPAELVAHQWLSGRKKGMLSSFVAGTIDQLLFAGLKSRHLALRHLALAGKVVVIDEAHAYDAFMNCYLDRVLEWLGAYRVPVVVLSATLPAGRRAELAAAYAGASVQEQAYAALATTEAYPLITAVAPGHAPVQDQPAASGRASEVQVEALSDDLDVLTNRLASELVDGGCVLVVRNTVNRVLETAEALRKRFGATAVTVAHARFVDADRAVKDEDLLARFGPMKACLAARPHRHIVVASQVAEQSLDVDFDLLVTDLAPIDLLLQRTGRLHRHSRVRPNRLRVARCLVTGADWQVPVPVPVSGSRTVYGLYALLRSAAVLQPHLSGRGLRLPQDISPLVQQAYGAGAVGPVHWTEALDEARVRHEKELADKEQRAGVFRIAAAARAGRPLTGWLSAGVGDADDTRAGRAQVRDSQESVEVIAVQQLPDGSLQTFPWLAEERGGLPLPQDAVPPGKAARAAAASALRLPLQLSQPRIIAQVIAELERFCPPAWQSKESHWLAGELILPFDADGRTRLAGVLLTYSRDDGLEVQSDS